MKKSRKILLYGLLSSILLIILCLYLHQGEFMNRSEDNISTLNEENISIEQVLKEYRKEKDSDKEAHPEQESILVDRTRIGKLKVEASSPSNISIEEKNITVGDKNTTVNSITLPEKNTTVTIDVKKRVETNISKKPEKIVDDNLPSLNHFPILDNGNLKDEKNSTLNLMQKKISNIIKHERIYFYKNRAKLTHKGKNTLHKIAKILKGLPDINITIKGYTDASGRRKLNQWISLERAKSVKRYLGSQGIAMKNIDAQGFGEEGLLYVDKPYSRLNRRVEIEIKRK